MRCAWLKTGQDGRTFFSDFELSLDQVDYGGASTPVLPAAGLTVTERQPGYVSTLHPAPRRQLNIVLSGIFQIECTNGETRQFRPGDVFLGDDLTGDGHVGRVIEGPVRLANIFAPDLDPSAWT